MNGTELLREPLDSAAESHLVVIEEEGIRFVWFECDGELRACLACGRSEIAVLRAALDKAWALLPAPAAEVSR